jgi:hypothetical protein
VPVTEKVEAPLPKAARAGRLPAPAYGAVRRGNA